MEEANHVYRHVITYCKIHHPIRESETWSASNTAVSKLYDRLLITPEPNMHERNTPAGMNIEIHRSTLLIEGHFH